MAAAHRLLVQTDSSLPGLRWPRGSWFLRKACHLVWLGAQEVTQERALQGKSMRLLCTLLADAAERIRPRGRQAGKCLCGRQPYVLEFCREAAAGLGEWFLWDKRRDCPPSLRALEGWGGRREHAAGSG